MAGLLGIGGGFVVVPLLLIILPVAGISGAAVAHLSIGTSLAVICITSASSAYAHYKKEAIELRLLYPLVPGLIIGAILGSLLAGIIQGTILILIFVSGALFTAWYLISDYSTSTLDRNTPSFAYFFYAQFTGLISALIGIGGGSVLVPYLVYTGIPMVRSVATAAACGFPIALFGSLGFVYSGWSKTMAIEYTTGYIYWPAFLGIALFSGLSAPLGAKMAHFIQEKQLKQIFALFLILTSAQIIYSQWFSTTS